MLQLFPQGSCTPGELYRTRTRTPALFQLIFQWILPTFRTARLTNLSPNTKSAARRDLDWSAVSARLLFDGYDAVLHNTVRTPSCRGHRSLPAAGTDRCPPRQLAFCVAEPLWGFRFKESTEFLVLRERRGCRLLEVSRKVKRRTKESFVHTWEQEGRDNKGFRIPTLCTFNET